MSMNSTARRPACARDDDSDARETRDVHRSPDRARESHRSSRGRASRARNSRSGGRGRRVNEREEAWLA